MRRIAVTVVGFLVTFVAAAIASAADSSPIPHEALQEMEYRVGEWESKTLIDGVEQPGTGHEVTKWAPGGRYCVIVTYNDVENGVARAATAIVGWDPDKKQLVERWHVSDGLFLSYRYQIDTVIHAWVGTVTYADTKGKHFEGKSVVQKKNNDEWTWKGTWTEDGKERSREAVNRRVKK